MVLKTIHLQIYIYIFLFYIQFFFNLRVHSMSPSATHNDFRVIVLGCQMYMYSYVQGFVVLPRIHTYALYCATNSPKTIERNKFPPETSISSSFGCEDRPIESLGGHKNRRN